MSFLSSSNRKNTDGDHDRVGRNRCGSGEKGHQKHPLERLPACRKGENLCAASDESWEPLIRVKVERFFVQKMKTKWGSCNPEARSIRLNTDLAKKPLECLEYILVYEMVHLLEPTHSRHFIILMDQFMPKWQVYRAQLNRLPVRHEERIGFTDKRDVKWQATLPLLLDITI